MGILIRLDYRGKIGAMHQKHVIPNILDPSENVSLGLTTDFAG